MLDQNATAIVMNKAEKPTFSDFGDANSVVVIIPYYNGSKYIERALLSVQDQTVPATEIIVVDDGSDPEHRGFLDLLVPRYRFRIIRQANGGQSQARNAGVSESRSKFICFLDQDDFYLPNHIEDLLSAVPKGSQRFGWTYGDVMEADEDGNIFQTRLICAYSDHPKTSLLKMVEQDMYVLPSASLISREAFDAAAGFDPQFRGFEDDDLFIRIFRLNYMNIFISKPVTVWCIRRGSTSRSIEMSRSRVLYFKKLVDLLPDDWLQRRFYTRDYFLPRFHQTVLRETIDALTSSTSPLFASKQEALDIFLDYIAFAVAQPSIPRRIKWRLKLHRAIISLCAPSLIRLLYNFRDWYKSHR